MLMVLAEPSCLVRKNCRSRYTYHSHPREQPNILALSCCRGAFSERRCINQLDPCQLMKAAWVLSELTPSLMLLKCSSF